MAAPPSEVPATRGPMVPASVRVIGRRRETADTWTLELAGDAPMRFRPGQFTMLGAAGRGEVPVSISGDPDEPGRLVHTVRAVGAATRAICATRPGQALAVRGPFGGSWPLEEAEGGDLAIVAGGIGLAPLRPAVLFALARPERFRRVLVFYGGRSPDQLLFGGELDAWRRRGAEVHVTVDAAPARWRGSVGVVTTLLERARLDGPAAVAMICGPEVMMRFAARALRSRGVAGDRIHLSMERNMQCGVGHCGHCQLGPTLVCRDGPVYRYSEIERWLAVREL